MKRELKAQEFAPTVVNTKRVTEAIPMKRELKGRKTGGGGGQSGVTEAIPMKRELKANEFRQTGTAPLVTEAIPMKRELKVRYLFLNSSLFNQLQKQSL